jgi:hypothetical protein
VVVAVLAEYEVGPQLVERSVVHAGQVQHRHCHPGTELGGGEQVLGIVGGQEPHDHAGVVGDDLVALGAQTVHQRLYHPGVGVEHVVVGAQDVGHTRSAHGDHLVSHAPADARGRRWVFGAGSTSRSGSGRTSKSEQYDAMAGSAHTSSNV